MSRKYYIVHGCFVNDFTLFYVKDSADANALGELLRRGADVERIKRSAALQMARRYSTRVYKATAVFIYDPYTNFGNDLIYMDHRGVQHGYKVL